MIAKQASGTQRVEMDENRQRILIVESEAKQREQAAQILAAEGFAVTAVADGFSAIRAAACPGRFALAVVAAELPGSLDGAATLRQVRARQPGLRALYTGDIRALPPRLDRDRDESIAAPFLRRELLGCVFELLQRGGAKGLGRAG